MTNRGSYMAKKIIKGILFFTLIFTIISYVVMLLWNWLMPSIFDLRAINFYEAAGLLLLSKILLGGFKKPHHRSKHWNWKHKWGSLSEEEKEKIKEKIKDYGVH